MALTPSQTEHYRQILLERRNELAKETVRAESEVGDQGDLTHLDYGDKATAAAAKDALLQEAGRESEQLQQIEHALARIAEGEYGLCAACGKPIPQSRLDAVPWATFCVVDQEIADEQRRDAGAMTGGAPSRVVR
jgi:DnaK suppressor protein